MGNKINLRDAVAAPIAARWAMLPSARIISRVNLRIICSREALEHKSGPDEQKRYNSGQGRRRRPGLRRLSVSGSLARPSLDELR